MWICGLLIDPKKLANLAPIFTMLLDSFSLWDCTLEEFHAKDIWQLNGTLSKKAIPRDARISLIGLLLRVSAELCIGGVAIRIPIPTLIQKTKRNRTPYDWALEFALERASSIGKCINITDITVVADQVGKPLVHINALRLYKEYGTGGYYPKNLENITDIRFADSKKEFGVQLADIVTYIFSRSIKDTKDKDLVARFRDNFIRYMRNNGKSLAMYSWPKT